jgi:transposase InsO family protein
MDLADSRTAMVQMGAGFEHFNEMHPHSALKMKSPREFMQHRAAQRRLAQVEQTLHREQSVA